MTRPVGLTQTFRALEATAPGSVIETSYIALALILPVGKNVRAAAGAVMVALPGGGAHACRTVEPAKTSQPALQLVPLSHAVCVLLLLHTVILIRRRIDSLRASWTAVTISLVIVVARLFWMMLRNPGAAKAVTTARTAIVINISRSVKPWFLIFMISESTALPGPGALSADERSDSLDQRHRCHG